MNYLKQFTLIIALSLLGESLSIFLPLPIPASIYGILILFVLLYTRLIRVEMIKEASSFLIAIMPVMFIPAASGLLNAFPLLIPALPAYTIITVVSTIIVMGTSGMAAQAILRKDQSSKEEHHD